MRYDNAEDAGYLFEKGRQRAQAEARRNNSFQNDSRPQTPVKKKNTGLWVAGNTGDTDIITRTETVEVSEASAEETEEELTEKPTKELSSILQGYPREKPVAPIMRMNLSINNQIGGFVK